MSSSRIGASPVQSALRWPRMNLSSATLRSSSTRGCLSSFGTLSMSIMLFQILFLVLLHILFRSELSPAVVDLVAAGELVGAVGAAPDDVALVVSAEHGRARHDPDVHAGLVLAV